MNKQPTLKAIAQSYQDTFESKPGQKVLADLERVCNRETYVRGDTHETAYREGQRRIYRRIVKMIEYAKNPNLQEPE